MLLREYLRDFGKELQDDVVRRWASGALNLSDESDARARLLVIKDILELEFAAMYEFYTGERLDDEHEHNEPGSRFEDVPAEGTGTGY